MTALIPNIPGKLLRALVVGAAFSLAPPVFADNLPEVQRLIKQGQYPQALEKVDSYLNGKPRDAQGRFLKGLILTEMNRPAEAISVFTRLTEDYPELPEPYNNLAVLYAQQKQFDKARTALEMAIRTHPSYAIAYENLGDIYAKLASQAYDKALQIDSSNAGAQNKMALIRDLISTSTRPNVKPQAAPAAVAATPAPAQPASKPVAVPSATVLTATPGAAANTAASKPPAEPAAAKQDAASPEVTRALENWAQAWAGKDMKTYLAAYGPDFKPPKGMSRSAWESEREARVAGKPGKISVSFDSPEVLINGDKATVKFRQHYKSGSLNTSTNKLIVFTRSNGKWLIQQEISR